MKKPIKAMVTIGIALILISGIAYAADKRKRTKQPLPPEAVPDDEAVKAELLAAVEMEQEKGKARQIDEGRSQSKDQVAAKQSR